MAACSRLSSVLLVALLLAGPVLTGCLSGDDAGQAGSYDARIRWTSYGIPHIEADDWGGIGYGYGFAAAKDYLCVIAEEYVTTAGERSQHFGPDGTYELTSNGQSYTNLESDLFFTLLDEHPDLVDSMADHPDQRVQDLLDGYVAGYNRYLEETPEDERPAECRGEDWVEEITREDVEHRVNKLNLIASMGFFAPSMVAAQPPGPSAPSASSPSTGSSASPSTAPSASPSTSATASPWSPTSSSLSPSPVSPSTSSSASASSLLSPEALERLHDRLPTPEGLGLGSNAYAFGAEMTANDRGMLMGNPHFPWDGPERFHQLHLTIPGQMDVMGMTLLGVPLVLIGFNDAVAWTHTVSTGWRFSLHELTLAPNDPTSYLVDGEVEAMQTRNVTVDVGDGETVSHTFYFSRYGPIIHLPVIGEGGAETGLTWERDRAYALNDANARNNRTAEQFIRWNTAESFDGFVDALVDVHGIPWVNTIAASPDGRAFYADVSVVPNYDEAKIDECNTPVGRVLFEEMRLPVFDGARSECAPTEDPDAAQPGIIPSDEMPRIQTRDWLLNSNDDFWLPNPEHPLVGYSPMIGEEETPRSVRTRMGYVLWLEREAGTEVACETDPEVPCDQLTLGRLQQSLFASRLYVPEHELDRILEGTCTPPVATSSAGEVVNLSEACEVLADWDRRADVDSAGLPLFERFWLTTPKTWSTPFDPEDPVHTPRGFVAEDPRVRRALADAVVELTTAGLPLDVTAGEARFVEHAGDKIPLHGARGSLGSPSMLVVPFEDREGFGAPVHGNSYIQTVTWDADGTPRAEAVLSYSQSPHEASPHHADQTRLYSEKTWVRLPFTEEQIQADPNLTTRQLDG